MTHRLAEAGVPRDHIALNHVLGGPAATRQ
jgi:hypothetical protein